MKPTTKEKRTWQGVLRQNRKPQQGKNTHLPTLDLEYSESKEGDAVYAQFVHHPHGWLYAETFADLTRGVQWLCTTIIEQEQQARLAGSSTRQLDIMQADIVNGEFLVRFPAMPGWGLCFTSQEQLKPWLAFLVKTLVETLPPSPLNQQHEQRVP